MPTVRREFSKKNNYYITKHRRYELEHFCRQYPDWKKELFLITGPGNRYFKNDRVITSNVSDPTAEVAIIREALSGRMIIVEKAAHYADNEIGDYILKGATEGLSWDELYAKCSIPCSSGMYYERLRRFYWYLDKLRK